ncbi:MAG: hypothetical protein KC776_15050 [Myxococcales bacterium]|nr:hypothetical protein [Myxococcales bacterium]
MTRFAVTLVSLLLLLGCSSSDGGGGSTPKPSSIVFVADAAPSGASVTLREKSLTNGELVLEVVAKGVSDVYGVAFRLSYDPAVAQLASLEPGALWGSPAPIAMASEKTPGLLVAVVSERGSAKGLVADDAVVATVTLKLTQAAETPISFVSYRSGVVGSDGERAAGVSFAGGALVKQ